TKIYARDGTTLLYEVFDPDGGQRTVIPFSELPETLKQATIAVEDANFYTNPGVNLPSVFRAVYANLTDQDQGQGGASTITQQLVRNVLLPPEERAQQTPSRKIREMILAYRITKEYSKEQVLALYLNEIPYGNSAYGAEAAALAYFGIHARDLSLAQSALLAGLPQSPSQLDPLVNPSAAKARQRIVLDRMVATGSITRQQADAAFAETLYVKPAQVDLRAPHFVFYVRDQLEARYGPELLYRGGLRVTTTLDPKWQDAAQAEVAKRIEEIRGQNATNGAVVMLDRQTNQVLALVGSADYNNAEIDGQVNVALADRQPGSTLKPLVYATAMMQGWTAAKVLWDVPTEYHFAGGEVYAPKNYDRLFHGPVSMRVALANSFNVPAVKTLEQIGLDAFLRQLHTMGISTLNDRPRYGLSLALGGGEVKLMELTAAYSVLANAGNYRPPVTILRVENTRGEVLEAWREPKAKPVLGPNGAQIAYVMSSMLSDNQARQWMFGPGNAMELPDGRPAAVKTGTTDDDRDSWTVGYTPQVVVGAWVGNSDNAPMDAVPGSFGAAVIWQRLMTDFHKGLPVEQFPRPGGIVEREVCVASGLLATPACPNKRTEVFVEGTEPTEADPIYKMVRVGPNGDCLAGPNQAGEERPFAEYPAEAGDWSSQGGLPPPPTKPCVDGATGVADLPAVIVEPASGATVGSSVRIRGSSAGPYVLDWGRGERPSSWTTILEGFGGVKNGLLGMWSHNEPEGVYTIRLRVQQPGGQLEQRVTVTVARAFLPTSVALAVPAGGKVGRPV
ncbi:MAG TPA: PBP1A family penicillin-binding protein, partial [Herpetosiphonaceae bacterium]